MFKNPKKYCDVPYYTSERKAAATSPTSAAHIVGLLDRGANCTPWLDIPIAHCKPPLVCSEPASTQKPGKCIDKSTLKCDPPCTEPLYPDCKKGKKKNICVCNNTSCPSHMQCNPVGRCTKDGL